MFITVYLLSFLNHCTNPQSKYYHNVHFPREETEGQEGKNCIRTGSSEPPTQEVWFQDLDWTMCRWAPRINEDNDTM